MLKTNRTRFIFLFICAATALPLFLSMPPVAYASDLAEEAEQSPETVPENTYIPVELSPLPTAATAEKPVSTQIHIVQKGDSLYEIARHYETEVKTIVEANELQGVRYIRPGDRLVIPSQAGVYHRVASGETLSTIATRYGTTTHKIQVANQLTDPDRLALKQVLFIPGATKQIEDSFQWPLKKTSNVRISSGFGYRQHPMGGGRRFHSGIDFAARKGTPIMAAQSGRVIQCGRNGLYGNCVTIEHKNGYSTLYAHASTLDVKKGQYVVRGQQIATVGSTGRSTGPHLHFELRHRGKAVNPAQHLPSFK